MNKYRIAYVDESDADIRRFQRFSYNYFEVIPFIPQVSKEETCNNILNSDVDAIISDYEFTEQLSNVHYDGTDLISLVIKKRDKFPVFILTSFEDDALSKGDDVNIIYEKKEMDHGDRFLLRVKAQIEKYKNQLEIDENRLLELISESRKRSLSALEIDELKQLDSKIEKTLDKENRIPDILRNDSEASGLLTLIKKVDELTVKLNNK